MSPRIKLAQLQGGQITSQVLESSNQTAAVPGIFLNLELQKDFIRWRGKTCTRSETRGSSVTNGGLIRCLSKSLKSFQYMSPERKAEARRRKDMILEPYSWQMPSYVQEQRRPTPVLKTSSLHCCVKSALCISWSVSASAIHTAVWSQPQSPDKDLDRTKHHSLLVSNHHKTCLAYFAKHFSVDCYAWHRERKAAIAYSKNISRPKVEPDRYQVILQQRIEGPQQPMLLIIHRL